MFELSRAQLTETVVLLLMKVRRALLKVLRGPRALQLKPPQPCSPWQARAPTAQVSAKFSGLPGRLTCKGSGAKSQHVAFSCSAKCGRSPLSKVGDVGYYGRSGRILSGGAESFAYRSELLKIFVFLSTTQD